MTSTQIGIRIHELMGGGMSAAEALEIVQGEVVKAAKPAERMVTEDLKLVTCPGCSGFGRLTDDPQVLQCDSCGGFFTNWQEPITREQAMKFVALHLPMLNHGAPDGTFYFDLTIYVEPRTMMGDVKRVHGWADRKTKRVVQWG